MSAQSHFEQLYAANEDPWGYGYRWYESRKRSVMLAALPSARYRFGFEPGCSIGMTSVDLSQRCDALLCVDPNADAVRSATQNLAAFPHASVRQASIPDEWPDQAFDLIVLSEMLYYLDADELRRTLRNLHRSLAGGGTVIACHWRHPIPESSVSVAEIHDAIATSGNLTRAVAHRETDFLLDVWTTETRSVAQREGLA